jgi:hypothetical protein
MICKPKENGGLGIVHFQKQNAALLIKFLDKFYNHREIPWVQLIWFDHYRDKISHAENLCGSFWWRDVLKLVDNFRGVAAVQLGKGDTFFFWSDNNWNINDSKMSFKSRFPRLYSYVLDENLSAANVCATQDTDLFYLPLSPLAFQELEEMKVILQENPVTDQMDIWSFTWGPKYTVAQFYRYIHRHIQVPSVYKWI